MDDILNYVFWGNTLINYVIVVIAIFVTWLVLKLIKRKLLGLLKKITTGTNTSFDDILVEITEKFVIPYLYLFINYSIITQLYLSARVGRILEIAFMFVTTYYFIRLINYTVHRFLLKHLERKNEPPERIKQVSGMLVVVKILTWGLGLVLLADNVGYDVTAIIAGLGIGGIAIALAAQNILGDLFSYFVIFFDKPFEIGDFIIVDNNSGIVEKIGIKTSHVRSLDGQQLVMPNTEMVKTVIQNFKRLERRRIVFSIGVVYYTPSQKLRKIPSIIEDIISKQEQATVDRVHLKSFGDFSVNYEIVYYIESADYLLYMNKHHEICLDIFERFEEEEIEFAFPTQTIFFNSQNKDQEKERKNGAIRNQSNQRHEYDS